MAITTNPAELVAGSICYDCISESKKGAVMIYILATQAGLTGLTPTQLLNSAKCYTCYNQKDQGAVIAYLLNQIANGVTVSDLVQNGSGDPVAAPSTGVGIYINTDDDSLWYYDGSAWVELIG